MIGYRLFGQEFRPEVVYGFLVALAVCLFMLRLRVLLLLTLVALILPSLNTPLIGLAKLLRWSFLAALFGRGLMMALGSGARLRPLTHVHRIVILLSVLIFASTTWSIGWEITVAQGIMMVVLWAAVFFLLWVTWRNEEDIRVLCTTLYALACILFVAEAAYLVFGLWRQTGGQRLSGIFSNPNGTGSAVAFLGPFVLWRHFATKSAPERFWIKVLAGFMLVSLYESGSRSGFLGTVMCMGLMLAYLYRFRIVITGAMLALPLLILVVYGSTMDTVDIGAQHIIRADTLATLGDRLPQWEKGFHLFLEKPVLGYGYGMNKFAEHGYASHQLARAIFALRGANYHNAHLQLGLDLGLVGLSLFWVTLATGFATGFRLFLRARRTTLDLAGMALFAAFLALAGDTFVHGWAFSPGSSMAIVFWIVLAGVLKVSVLSEQAARDEARERQSESPLMRSAALSQSSMVGTNASRT